MQGIELQLKHVHAAGMYGWGNVGETVLGEWLEDISQNQVRFSHSTNNHPFYGFRLSQAFGTEKTQKG